MKQRLKSMDMNLASMSLYNPEKKRHEQDDYVVVELSSDAKSKHQLLYGPCSSDKAFGYCDILSQKRKGHYMVMSLDRFFENVKNGLQNLQTEEAVEDDSKIILC